MSRTAQFISRQLAFKVLPANPNQLPAWQYTDLHDLNPGTLQRVVCTADIWLVSPAQNETSLFAQV